MNVRNCTPKIAAKQYIPAVKVARPKDGLFTVVMCKILGYVLQEDCYLNIEKADKASAVCRRTHG